ncbi:hypothetical protein HMI54_011864 [Coelomomyces lativittatus]|nr:hypothetical protein HMI54_011864 [Coelomomyces lativittatus]
MNVHTLKDQYAEYVAASNYSELALLNYTCLLELTHPEVNDVKQSLLKAWLKVSDTVDPACLRLS